MSKVQEGKHRRNSGNMMLLSILGFILLFAFITMGTSFSMVLFLQSQVQKLADEVAMAGACQLNDGNRFGQMNDLVVRCRELVFASRQNCDTSFNNRNKELEQLTQQLLDEDRQNALLLEKERASLRTLAIKEATLTMNDVFSRQKAVYGLALPWLVVRPPVLSDLRFGSIS